MWCCGSSYEDSDGALNSGKDGGRLTIIESGVSRLILVVTYPKCIDDILGVRRFSERVDDTKHFGCETFLFICFCHIYVCNTP